MNSLLLLCLILSLCAMQGLAQREFTPGELAATYSIGHRFGGSSLTLRPDGSYAVESGDCTMEYLHSGTYAFAEGVLRFTISKYVARRRGGEEEINLLDPNGRKEVLGKDASEEIEKEFKLIPVRWAERIYLIDEDDLSQFANAVNLGIEPRAELSSEPYFGSFYLRRGDEQKRVSGSPALPRQWLSFLLARPVTATIVNVEGDGEEKTATINKGSKDRLKVGMKLIAKDEEPSRWMGTEVISVEEKSAKVRTSADVKIGDNLSTKYTRRDIYR